MQSTEPTGTLKGHAKHRCCAQLDDASDRYRSRHFRVALYKLDCAVQSTARVVLEVGTTLVVFCAPVPVANAAHKLLTCQARMCRCPGAGQ